MSERRVHSWWLARECYRRAAWVAALIGAGLALVPVILTFQADGVQAFKDVQVVASSAAFLAAGFFIPRWIVQALWRRQKARHDMDWP